MRKKTTAETTEPTENRPTLWQKRLEKRRETMRELGFGNTATTATRLMNPDGSFNTERVGQNWRENVYHFLITISWGRFTALIFTFYTVLNSLVALIFVKIGVENLTGVEKGTFAHEFMEAFFFSTQSLTTVGYGRVAPIGFAANTAASLLALIGLLTFAIISGLLYGRFSRPTARIVFSEKAVIAPYRGTGRGFMFRMANGRKSELIEAETTLILAINEHDDVRGTTRRFFALDLEISKITFFNLSWTLVHPITEKSPLFGLSEQDLIESKAEFLALIKATDDTYAQLVHARMSYSINEIEWGARFLPIFGKRETGVPTVDLLKLGATEKVELPILSEKVI